MISPISTSSLPCEAGRNPKITMSSGRAGSTRKMLASMDSRSSASPPAYPAVTPITTDSTVAASPARNATSMVLRPPASSWDSTSCCCWVVPSRCAADGGSGKLTVAENVRPGLYGASHGPIAASTAKPASIARPVSTFGDRGSRSIRRPAAASGPAAGSGPAPPAPPGPPGPPAPAGPAGPPRVVLVPMAMAQASCLVRGSRNTYTKSAARLASSTASMMTRKMPCSSA